MMNLYESFPFNVTGSPDSMDVQLSSDTIYSQVSASNSDSSICTSRSLLSAASGSRISSDQLSVVLREACPHIRMLVVNWTKSYRAIQSEALRTLLELILQSAGVMRNLDRDRVHEINSMDLYSIDILMYHAMPKPFIYEQIFLNNLKTFLRLTLKETVLINRQFMETVIDLLSLMGATTWVNSRFTAMQFGAQITELYCEFIKILEMKIEGDANNLAPSLSDNLRVARGLFDRVLDLHLHSLRDYDVGTRKKALTILTHWFNLHPDIFLNDCYLRYVSWAIFDDNNSIRLLAVQMCTLLFASDARLTQLDMFVRQVLPYLFSRTEDEYVAVAVEAVHTIRAINRVMPEVLDPAKLVTVYKLIYSVREPLGLSVTQLLYDVLIKNNPESNRFLREVTIFLYESEMFFDGLCAEELAKKMLVYARYELTNWQAWLILLLESNLEKVLQPIACRLLLAVIDIVIIPDNEPKLTSYSFHSIYCNVLMEKKRHSGKKTVQSRKFQKELTLQLGPSLLKLWERYKMSFECLNELILIPQYFANHIEDLDMSSLCFFLIIMTSHHRTVNPRHISTLASIRTLMTQSPRWLGSVTNIETLIFFKVTREFLTVCQRMVRQDDPCGPQDKLIMKRAFMLSVYFDMVDTVLYSKVIEALHTAFHAEHYLVYKYCVMISVNLATWHLTRIMEGTYSTSKEDQISKLSQLIKILDLKLKPMLCSVKTAFRKFTYKVYCYLLVTFGPHKQTEPALKPLHYPRPTLVVCEWLNYSLYNEVPRDQVASGAEKNKAKTMLRLFCSLLIIQAMPISYLSSILPYFRHHNKKDNYNDLLKRTLDTLILRDGVPSQLVDSLFLLWIKMQSQILEVSKGICQVVFTNTKTGNKSLIDTAFSIVITGFEKIEAGNFSFIVAIVPFLLLLPPQDIDMVVKNIKEKHPEESNRFDRLLSEAAESN